MTELQIWAAVAAGSAIVFGLHIRPFLWPRADTSIIRLSLIMLVTATAFYIGSTRVIGVYSESRNVPSAALVAGMIFAIGMALVSLMRYMKYWKRDIDEPERQTIQGAIEFALSTLVAAAAFTNLFY